METAQQKEFSGPVRFFLDRWLAEVATPVGYAALLDAYGIQAPTPATLCAIGAKHRTRLMDQWRIFTPRYAPPSTLAGHLVFALKYEGLDLCILKRLFLTVGPEPIREMVLSAPMGNYARRLWYLYEWLLDERLDLPDVKNAAYVPVVNPELQYAVEAVLEPRQRVRANLPGTAAFCPLVFRTHLLEEHQSMGLKAKASGTIARLPEDTLTRAVAFLLLKDTKASYAIEGEQPPHVRIQRWGKAIAEAGHHAIDLDEILRLQKIAIGDQRLFPMGLRQEGGFIGDMDRDGRTPLPVHVSARHDDLPSLIEGLLSYGLGAGRSLDPVLAATILSFGFVYIHPLVDGNGRLHRYLLHHWLAHSGFVPKGLVFPLSATILDDLDSYRKALESYSTRLLPLVDWRPTERGNVEILNDTADFYRFFDATPHAEFLYSCVRRSIEEDLPQEVAYLRSHDQARAAIANIMEMPQRIADRLILFVRQNEGRLPKRRRKGEFAALTDQEVFSIERAIASAFDEAQPDDPTSSNDEIQGGTGRAMEDD